jgi:hypothetical protein
MDEVNEKRPVMVEEGDGVGKREFDSHSQRTTTYRCVRQRTSSNATRNEDQPRSMIRSIIASVIASVIVSYVL